MPGRTGKYCKIWLVFSHVDNSFHAKPFTIPLNHYVSALYSVLADLEFFLHQYHTSYKKKKKITLGSSVNLNVSEHFMDMTVFHNYCSGLSSSLTFFFSLI